jgi:hypothetical protein
VGRLWPGPDCVVNAVGKAAGPVAEADSEPVREGVAAPVREDEILFAVTVEVADLDRGRTLAATRDGAGSEGPVSQTQEDRQVVRAPVRGDEVLLAVAVEVTGGDRVRGAADAL